MALMFGVARIFESGYAFSQFENIVNVCSNHITFSEFKHCLSLFNCITWLSTDPITPSHGSGHDPPSTSKEKPESLPRWLER